MTRFSVNTTTGFQLLKIRYNKNYQVRLFKQVFFVKKHLRQHNEVLNLNKKVKLIFWPKIEGLLHDPVKFLDRLP